MTRPILVFGAGGRVGGELMPLSDRLIGLDREQLDLTACEEIEPLINAANPAAIINLAACTLPRAEREDAFADAFAVNIRAVSWMGATGCPLVHISTDCVFDGAKSAPYEPHDKAEPINHYGLTKRVGENEITLAGKPHIIIRTTGVYLRHKPNFLEGVLTKAAAGETMEVVSDTLYTPTDARELARAILTATERVIEDPSVSGTYHFAGPDVMSYLEFARLVAEEAGVSLDLKPTTAAEREKIEGFKRPKNAALNSDKFAEVFGLMHRPTRECVRELVNPAKG